MYPLRRSCREVTRLVLQSPEHPPGLLDGAAMRLHWWMCDRCRRFRDQARLLQQALPAWRRYRDQDEDEPPG
ncbi:MAG: zf-HC2 domain-containing protein [Burkholderiaceae bacterium]|nr:zf-HC2 domain-containing protein [Burkholderiaceae bacterium]